MLKIEDPTNEMFCELRKTNDEQKKFISDLREKANELLNLINQLENSRRKSLAITNLEECVLFATKAACYGA